MEAAEPKTIKLARGFATGPMNAAILLVVIAILFLLAAYLFTYRHHIKRPQNIKTLLFALRWPEIKVALTTLLWVAPFVALLALSSAMVSARLVELVDTTLLSKFTTVAFWCGIAVLPRHWVLTRGTERERECICDALDAENKALDEAGAVGAHFAGSEQQAEADVAGAHFAENLPNQDLEDTGVLALSASTAPDDEQTSSASEQVGKASMAAASLPFGIRLPNFKFSADAAQSWASTWLSDLSHDLPLLFIASAISAVALEVACNEGALNVPLGSYLYSIVLIFLLMLAVYFLAQHVGFICLVVPMAFAVAGVAEYFVVLFKGQAILPSDVMSVETAAAVADGYIYTIGDSVYIAAILLAIALVLLAYVAPAPFASFSVAATSIVANCVCGVAVLAFAFAGFGALDVEALLGFSLNTWWPLDTYEEQGLIPSFIAAWQQLQIDEPEDYTDESAETTQTTLAASYDATTGISEARTQAVAQFKETQPSVICIMNESFSDLSTYDFMQAVGYTGPAYYNSLADTLQRGSLHVSTSGGGTAMTEFEFLTGNSMAFTGNTQPYQMYNFTNVDSLAKQFSQLGYDTTAMHPNRAINYRRDTVYAQLGFDEFLDIEDFEDCPTYHSGATDASTYDKILEILETDSDPQFIFDLTMQNHGGYGRETVPEEDKTNFYPEGLSQNLSSQLNVYLACINRSDSDLEAFIETLRNLDRPVVVVFFGDHQPTVGPEMYDELNPNVDSFTRLQTTTQTTYIIWANYDVAGNDQVSYNEPISASELGLQMLNLVGAPLTDYQKAVLATRKDLLSVAGPGVLDITQTAWALDDSSDPYYATLNEIACMQYLNFGKIVN